MEKLNPRNSAGVAPPYQNGFSNNYHNSHNPHSHSHDTDDHGHSHSHDSGYDTLGRNNFIGNSGLNGISGEL